MPRHLGIGANVVKGIVSFNGTKTAQADFKDDNGNPVGFTQEPNVQLTLLDANGTPAYKVKGVKTGNVYTGFVIGFSQVQTMAVAWRAEES